MSMSVSKRAILDICGEDVRCILNMLLRLVRKYCPDGCAAWYTSQSPYMSYDRTLIESLRRSETKITVYSSIEEARKLKRTVNKYVYIIDTKALYVYFNDNLIQVQPHPPDYINNSSNMQLQEEEQQYQEPEIKHEIETQIDVQELLSDLDKMEISIRDLNDSIINYLDKVPEKPCIYVMYCRDSVLYIGKSVNCRSRLRRHLEYNNNGSSSLKKRIAQALGISIEDATRLLQNIVTRIECYVVSDSLLEKLLNRYLRLVEKNFMNSLRPILSEK